MADLDDCWLWAGDITPDGYGRQGRTFAHWIGYELNGRVRDPKLSIDHLCGVPRCINPDHMEQVPIGINVLRGNSVSGVNKRKTQCNRGHPFDEANTQITPKGKRDCRKCGVIRTTQFRAGNKLMIESR